MTMKWTKLSHALDRQRRVGKRVSDKLVREALASGAIDGMRVASGWWVNEDRLSVWVDHHMIRKDRARAARALPAPQQPLAAEYEKARILSALERIADRLDQIERMVGGQP